MKNLLLTVLSLLLFISCQSTKEHYDSGELKAIGKTRKGGKSGHWKIFHKNGGIYELGAYQNNSKTGLWKIYHENGNLRQVGEFNAGKQNGAWRFYHDNANKEGIGTLENGKLIGKWIWYHTNGKIYTERLYESGQLMEIISCFDGHGNPLYKGSLENGSGSLNNYDIDGKLLEVHNFENGKFKN